MKIRQAKRSDKEIVLQFCMDTFSWGDYIDRVFDKWYREPNGKLFVAVNHGATRNGTHYHSLNSNLEKSVHITNALSDVRPIAVSHVVLCPDKARLWIEGIRVDPNNRRHKVATALIDKMLQYGKCHGAIEASAIISVSNKASKSLFYNNGFNIISKWAYYKIAMCNGCNRIDDKTNKVRIAASDNAADVWSYIKHSKTYRLSGKRYFNEWRWYPLEYKTILDFAVRRNLLIIENEDSIEGVALINTTRRNDNASQIVYLDASSTSILKDLVAYCADIHSASLPIKENEDRGTNGHNLKQLEIISFQTNRLSKIMRSFKIEGSAQFFLYNLSLNY